MSKLIDITGQRFGRLTVVERDEENHKRWICKCDCGNMTKSDSYMLRHGQIVSCGCYHRELCGDQHRTHGMTKSRLYHTLNKMKERCYHPENDNYKWYGGKGITICQEWLNDPQTFIAWALSHGYADNLTIDRIDSSKNYEPSNCRWITIKEQQRNRCNTVYVEYEGKRMPLVEASELSGIKRCTLAMRLKNGLTGDELFKEIRKDKRYDSK